MNTSMIVLVLMFFVVVFLAIAYKTVKLIKPPLTGKKYRRVAAVAFAGIVVATTLSFSGYYFLEIETYTANAILFITGAAFVFLVVLFSIGKKNKEA